MSQDFLARARKAHGLPPSGEYLAQIVARSAANQLFGRGSTSGVAFQIEIIEGEFAGRRLSLNVVLDGPSSSDFIIERNLNALASWADAVGAKPADDAAGLIFNLWKASRSKRVLVSLRNELNPATGFASVALIGARVGVSE